MDETIRSRIKQDCDTILANSKYALTFEPVNDDFDFPNVTYFDMEGNAVQVSYVSKTLTYLSAEMLENLDAMTEPVTALLQDVRDLLYALEGAALSILAMDYKDFEESGALADGVPKWAILANLTIEGSNLLELFTNLLARHQDKSTREHFLAELKRLNGDMET